jgi:hypothetical protein
MYTSVKVVGLHLSDRMRRAEGDEIQEALNLAASHGEPIRGCTIKIKQVGFNLVDVGLAQAVGQSIVFSMG